ncbi:putative dehydrogenase [Evansella vedderi]|uniref:Dehydrogenase n=1 Tax=Evansella vedderi TaxID=38282 RepID=A0ABT9ZUE2_9BACI|nr:Gfo/Idh/MocA family oxidoreductase [Evansella vedderi]MDQ0254865.1 putative dehydrogenase [Evansella vedderi]
MIHIGVIGLGAVGERLIKGFLNKEEIKLSICDTSIERLQYIKDTYHVENSFTYYKDVLKAMDIDAVYVAVPPKFHEKIVKDAIAAGKHLLCEKPLANSVEEGKRMLKAVEGTNLVNAMHFPLNYQDSIVQLEKLIKDNVIGDVRRINLKMHFPHWPRLWQQNNWVASREQGGFILEVGVHWIQLIQRFFGKIDAVKSTLQFPEDPSLCENGIVAEMKLEDGTPILIDGLSNIGGEEQLEFAIYGTNGTMMIRSWRKLFVAKNGEDLQEIQLEAIEGNQLIDEFIKGIKGEPAELYTFSNGYHAQVVLEALRNPQNNDWQTLTY